LFSETCSEIYTGIYSQMYETAGYLQNPDNLKVPQIEAFCFF